MQPQGCFRAWALHFGVLIHIEDHFIAVRCMGGGCGIPSLVQESSIVSYALSPPHK